VPGFVAKGVVEPLDYDFAPYSSASGTIKEPSDEQIGQFLEDMKKFYGSLASEQASFDDLARGDDGGRPDPARILEALNDLDLGGMIGKIGEMASAYSKLCSGRPTAAQIQSLPLRVRAHFFAWLQGEVVNPEAAPGAGKAQVVTLRTEKAG
jgi:hypothetical protein